MTYTKIDRTEELPVELAAGFRADAMHLASQPEEFWNRQRIRIRARVSDRRRPSAHKLWIALACAVLLMLAILLTTPTKYSSPAAPVRAEVDPDQELLMAVEHALASATPEALEPVALSVDPSLNHTESVIEKEKHNEN